MELASETRRSMIQMLSEKDCKASEIAKQLDMTIQETHRNTIRLSETGIIRKNPQSFLSLTPYGNMIVSQLGSFNFLNANKNYFDEHGMGLIPSKFVDRIGNLKNCEFIHGTLALVERWKEIANNSEKFLKIVSAQIPPEYYNLILSRAKKDISVSLVHGGNTIVPKNFKSELSGSETRKVLSRGTLKRKMIPKVDLIMVFNEKQGAVSFPDIKGEPDMEYSFLGNDSNFHEWCTDYFDTIWENAETYNVSKIIAV